MATDVYIVHVQPLVNPLLDEDISSAVRVTGFNMTMTRHAERQQHPNTNIKTILYQPNTHFDEKQNTYYNS